MAATKMYAKYQGRCKKCGGGIAVGNEILWEAGRGASHVQCATKPDPIYNSPPPTDIVGNVDPAVEATRYGRTAVAGATPKSFDSQVSRGEHCRASGTVVRVKGHRYVVLGHTRPQYLSREWLEDMDEFEKEPGLWYEFQAVEVEPTAEEAEQDDAAVKAKADAEAAKLAAAEAVAVKLAAAEAVAVKLTAGLVRGTVGPCPESDVVWEKDAALRFEDDYHSLVYTRGKLTDGRLVISESSHAYDDDRSYIWGPAEVLCAWALAYAAKAGITVEKAREYMAKYSGCYGSDLYRAVVEAAQ